MAVVKGAVENVMLPVPSFSMTGVVLGQWWSGETFSKDGQREVYGLGNDTLTAIRSDFTLVQRVLGSFWCTTMPAYCKNVQ